MAARIDHAVVSGTFTLDGETFDVDNNIWVVGDDEECVVIDAPHDVDDILAVVGGRKVKAILLHARPRRPRPRRPALREKVVAPIMLHPDDKPLWELTHTDHLWDLDLADGFRSTSAAPPSRALHTPGPRARRGLLLRRRPGLRLHRRHPLPGRSGRDRPLVQRRRPDQGVDPARLFALPDETVVHTGHGDDTTIGAERSALGQEG